MDKRAYTETYIFIEMLPEELRRKIPDSLIEVIKSNMDTSYKFEIDDESLDDIKLLEDTEKILSVIYTDYLASDDEKKIIKNMENSILKEKENRKKENFAKSYYNFPKKFSNFENNGAEVTDSKQYYKDVNEIEREMNKIMKVPKERWYKKFIRIIKNAIHK